MFADLGDPAREALLKMGFYEEQYNCYINHYQGKATCDVPYLPQPALVLFFSQ